MASFLEKLNQIEQEGGDLSETTLSVGQLQQALDEGVTPSKALGGFVDTSQSPLSFTDRAKLDFGDEAGILNTLQEQGFNPIRDTELGIVLEKDGKRFVYDEEGASLKDVADLSREALVGTAQIASEALGASLGSASGPLGVAVGSAGGGALGGAGGEAAAQQLGTVLGVREERGFNFDRIKNEALFGAIPGPTVRTITASARKGKELTKLTAKEMFKFSSTLTDDQIQTLMRYPDLVTKLQKLPTGTIDDAFYKLSANILKQTENLKVVADDTYRVTTNKILSTSDDIIDGGQVSSFLDDVSKQFKSTKTPKGKVTTPKLSREQKEYVDNLVEAFSPESLADEPWKLSEMVKLRRAIDHELSNATLASQKGKNAFEKTLLGLRKTVNETLEKNNAAFREADTVYSKKIRLVERLQKEFTERSAEGKLLRFSKDTPSNRYQKRLLKELADEKVGPDILGKVMALDAAKAIKPVINFKQNAFLRFTAAAGSTTGLSITGQGALAAINLAAFSPRFSGFMVKSLGKLSQNPTTSKIIRGLSVNKQFLEAFVASPQLQQAVLRSLREVAVWSTRGVPLPEVGEQGVDIDNRNLSE